MGGPPAVIIVVRHGARLDAADKQWHLNSPTPYDPPLTYGGWTQCRTLGVRIANLLGEIPSQPSLELNDQSKRKRKHRVVIHTSPFLRCIQTSIALASGLAAIPSPAHLRSEQLHSLARRAVTMPQFSHSAARSSSRNRLDSQILAPLPEAPSSPPTSAALPQSKSTNEAHQETHTLALPIQKAILRVDAFLGEWLSPDYFEQITPPPSSVMMVAAAKADLLRREDYAHLNTGGMPGGTLNPPSSGFPGGWGSPNILSMATRVAENATSDADDDLPVPALPMPKHNRTSSMSSVGSSNSSRLSGHPTIRPASSHHNENGIYVPPVPHYAISSGDPIPPGYVAHSKDACVDVDYQWDSMREPQDWGNGGEYGEEWGSMHKRFRKGLKQMVEWYRTHDAQIHRTSSRPSSRPGTSGGGSGSWESSEHVHDGEEEDLVVILVTHGAGCNALIGALTNQPALLDVGMANLTMAVRKAPHQPPSVPSYLSPSSSSNSPNTTPKPMSRPSPMHSRSSSRVLTLSDEYELKLLNSSEHLRRSSTTSSASSFNSNLPSLPYRPFLNRPSAVPSGSDTSSAPFIEPIRASYGGFGSAMSDLLPGCAGLRRTVSVASGSGSSAGGRTYTPRFKGSVGLWSPRKPSSHEDDKEEEGEDTKMEEDTRGDDMVLNFAEEREARESQPVTPAAVEVIKEMRDLRVREATQSEPGPTRNRRQSESGDGSNDYAIATLSPSKGGGLWSEKKLPEEAGMKPQRAEGPKRRWTVTEKGAVMEHGLDRV